MVTRSSVGLIGSQFNWDGIGRDGARIFGKSVGSVLCLFSVSIFNAVTLLSHSNNKSGKKYIFVEKIGNWLLYNYVFRLPQLVS